MVKKVDAWQASSGKLFDDRHAAAVHEAEEQIKKMKGLDNPAIIASIIDNSRELWEVLSDLHGPRAQGLEQ